MTTPHGDLGRTAVVAAFDLDGTLTEGGSVLKWLRFIGGRARVWRAVAWRALPLLWGALRSGAAADHAKERLFHAILHGRSLDDVVARSTEFADAHLATHGRTLFIERLHWHVQEGHTVVIVSASPEIYVQVIARELGATAAIGTRLAVDPLGRMTGGYLGKNCRGDEKARRLAEWTAATFGDRPVELYAYGNSRGDKRMLEAADHAYDAGKLGKLGAMRAFERLSTP